MQEELREFLCSEQGLRGESPGQERASNDSFLPPYMQLSATAEPSTDEEHEKEDAVDWRGGAQGTEVSGELGITGKPSVYDVMQRSQPTYVAYCPLGGARRPSPSAWVVTEPRIEYDEAAGRVFWFLPPPAERDDALHWRAVDVVHMPGRRQHTAVSAWAPVSKRGVSARDFSSASSGKKKGAAVGGGEAGTRRGLSLGSGKVEGGMRRSVNIFFQGELGNDSGGVGLPTGGDGAAVSQEVAVGNLVVHEKTRTGVWDSKEKSNRPPQTAEAGSSGWGRGAWGAWGGPEDASAPGVDGKSSMASRTQSPRLASGEVGILSQRAPAKELKALAAREETRDTREVEGKAANLAGQTQERRREDIGLQRRRSAKAFVSRLKNGDRCGRRGKGLYTSVAPLTHRAQQPHAMPRENSVRAAQADEGPRREGPDPHPRDGASHSGFLRDAGRKMRDFGWHAGSDWLDDGTERGDEDARSRLEVEQMAGSKALVASVSPREVVRPFPERVAVRDVPVLAVPEHNHHGMLKHVHSHHTPRAEAAVVGRREPKTEQVGKERQTSIFGERISFPAVWSERTPAGSMTARV